MEDSNVSAHLRESSSLPIATEMGELTQNQDTLDSHQDSLTMEGSGCTSITSEQQSAGTEESSKQPSTVTPTCSTQKGEQSDSQSSDGYETDKHAEEKTLITLTVDKTGLYHCSECDISAQGHAFEEHIMCHLMLRPYQCLYCSQSFINRRQVLSHVLKEHADKKMNCALKALKRARGIMKAALESGRHEFYASIPGKVPLVKEPAKSRDRLKTFRTSGESSSCESPNSAVLNTDCKQPVTESDGSCAAFSSSKSGIPELFQNDTSKNSTGESQDDDHNVFGIQDRIGANQDCSHNSENRICNKQENDENTVDENNDKMNSVDDCHNYDGPGHSCGPDITVTTMESDSSAHPVSTDGSKGMAENIMETIVSVPGMNATVDTAGKTNETLGSFDGISRTNELENKIKRTDAAETDDPQFKNGEAADLTTNRNETEDLVAETKSANETDSANQITSSTNSGEKEFAVYSQGQKALDHEDLKESEKELSVEYAEEQNSLLANCPYEQDEKEQWETAHVDIGVITQGNPKDVQAMEVDNISTENQSEMECDESKSYNDSADEKDVGNLKLDPPKHNSDGKGCVHPENLETGQEKNGGSSPSSKSKDVESDHVKNRAFPLSNFEQSEEEQNGMGLKIVAAFSLQDDDHQKENSNQSEKRNKEAAGSEELASQKDPEQPVDLTVDDIVDDTENSMVSKHPTVHLTLGPPSKPVPASSFLELPSHSLPITSHGNTTHTTYRNVHFFICGFNCNFSCLTSVEFRDHLVLDHAGELVFTCFHCGYQSASEDGLIRHISAHAHTYSKSVPLYICGASACKFGSNLVADFITHQSAWHPELTVFHCHDCDECFSSVDELLKHYEANFLHIINCPHCTAKTTERRTLLNHIASVHPGKPKMVSVAKQVVCRDRKLNDYVDFMHQRFQAAASDSLSLDTFGASSSDQKGTYNCRNKSLLSILTEPIQPQERELTNQSASTSRSEREIDIIDDNRSFEEVFDESGDEEEYGQQAGGSQVDKQREIHNFRCNFCTFVARDQCRLEGHERGHSLPPSRKSRFKCTYCPQGFNNDVKFNSHISCHPGLIKFNLYNCKYCEFDSNQRHVIVKHARSSHNQNSRETNEENLFTVTSKTIDTRVLECYQCSYMTRHRKHLLAHLKREHSSVRRIPTSRDLIQKSSQSPGRSCSSALEMALNQDHTPQFSAGNDGDIRENQARRFKCPICQYLLPRAADLKAHVKRHSEIGEITLVMFRCKYCSAASTAREIVYGHLMEKHLGKPIALVKKIMTIDARGDDNGYAVTSVDDEKDCETENPAMSESSETADKMVLVIPDSAGETFQSQMPCPRCSFASFSRQTIIHHVTKLHSDVKIMGRREDNEVYPLDISYSASEAISEAHITVGESLKGEILIVPDSPTFDEAVVCPKCDFSTMYRKSMVQHLDEKHPEVSVMGRNDYPTFDGKGQAAVEANATGRDGMVIIGSGSLDEKIRCLYENYGDRMKCMICHTYRPKKFFIHVHILRHLNILLWGCQYCSHRGLQKYKMMDHIKKVHPKRAYCVRYLPVNVEEKVNQYLKNASMIRARKEDDDGSSPCKSPVPSSYLPLAMDTDVNDMRLKYKATQDNLVGCIIGSDELDMKLACLYSLSRDNQYRCVVCTQEFYRKFAIHRHLVQAHLKVNLIGCGYCEVEGVERHVMMDHILETHKSSSISMRNLAHTLQDKVTEFLTNMTVSADAALDLTSSDPGFDDDLSFKLPDPSQLTQSLRPLEMSSPSGTRSSPARTPSPATSTSTSSSGKNQLNPNLLLLGKDSLNKHLQVMFKLMPGPVMKYRCLVCRGIFDRKYAIHRHLLMKHLKVGIIGCPYCTFEGVERYQVFAHIKEEHKDDELRMCHLSVDLDSIVSAYMQNVANGTIDPNSKAPPPWSMRKICVKKEVIPEEEKDPCPSTSSVGGQGLVVAMFGSRRSGITIKQEPVDEMEGDSSSQEPMEMEMNREEEGVEGIDTEGDGSVDEDEDCEVSFMSLQNSNGTKGKMATDVQTSIRVITVKEKGIKRHTCEKCKFTSLHRSNIVRHIYRVHEQYREQECPACNYRTLSRVLMEQHVHNEHPGIPYPQDMGLKRKADISFEDMEYEFANKRQATAAPNSQDTDLPSPNSSKTQRYACAYCSFETRTHSDIVQHTRDNHLPGETMKDPEEEGQAAEPAGEGAEDMEFKSLVSTVKMSQVDMSGGAEDWLWQCFCCSYKTSDEEDLKLHFVETHPCNVYRYKKIPTWRFVCRSCNVKTRAHSKMRYHLNRHINYRPYTCTTCGSFYPSPDQCRKHCRANNHSETFTYIKIARKEKRLQELLKESQEIALALTRTPDDANISKPSFSYSIPSKRKAKKSFPSSGIPMIAFKSEEYDEAYSPKDGQGEEEGQMVCASCDFSAQTVHEVWTHFVAAHPDQEFRWLDSYSGHICTETGEITNAKDVPPDLEPPSGTGYTMTSSGLLGCNHCQFATSTVQAIKSHLRRHLPKLYLCPYCSMRCSRRDTVTLHVRCAHKDRELWIINFQLPFGFVPDSDDADRSVDLAEPQVTFQTGDQQDDSSSPLPQTSSSSSSSVRRTRYTVSERIACGQCELKTDSVFTVYQHHCDHHPDLDFLWVDSANGYTFNHSGEVIDAREHTPNLFTKDGFTVESDSGNVPSFCCKRCHFSSAFIQAIKSHMKSHLPHGFMCPYCCMTANSKDKMVSHQSCVHRGQEHWVLHLRMSAEASASPAVSAGVAASSGEKNLVNSSRQQSGVTSYSCSECNYATEDLYQYRLHLASHGGFSHLVRDLREDLPFKCGYCVYVAEDEGDFGAHIASHLDCQNFACSQCPFTAFKRFDVQSHILTTHSEIDQVQVIELKVENNVSEQGGLQLVNLDPKVKVMPVNDFDLDREGLTLFSPPSSPEVEMIEGGGGSDADSEEVDIIGVDIPGMGHFPVYAREQGGRQDQLSTEKPSASDQPQTPPAGGNDILRLTLQATQIGSYGIKQVPKSDTNTPHISHSPERMALKNADEGCISFQDRAEDGLEPTKDLQEMEEGDVVEEDTGVYADVADD